MLAFIDMEHTTFDLHDVQLAVMAAERVGITPSYAPQDSIRPSSCGSWTWVYRVSRCRMSATRQPRALRYRRLFNFGFSHSDQLGVGASGWRSLTLRRSAHSADGIG